jgi:hypothetical protein
MSSATPDETRRTSPLALWRYAHDYLRVARNLSRQHRIASIESQAAHHVAAQGIEFALKAFLTARGAGIAELRAEIGRSLASALTLSQAQGLPPLPAPWQAAIAEVAACHQDTQFVYLQTDEHVFPDLDPLIDVGIFILDSIAPDVAVHFVVNLGGDTSPTVETFVRRLRADLSATMENIPPLEDDPRDPHGLREHPAPSERPLPRRLDA